MMAWWKKLSPKTKKYVLWGGGALAFFLFRKKAVEVGAGAYTSATNAALALGEDVRNAYLKLSMPSEARAYFDVIKQVAWEQDVDPLVIATIGQKESRWGEALTPKGPGGTGDFIRRGSSYPYPLPPDGLGWGRGLMQIDYYWHNAWVTTHDWSDPYTILTYAIGKIFVPAYNAALKAGLTGDAALQDAFRRYNGSNAAAYTYGQDAMTRLAAYLKTFTDQIG